MLRLGCIERKEKGKTRGAGGLERATAHFGSFVAIGFARVVLRQSVFLSRPTGQTRARDRALDSHNRPWHAHECTHQQ